MPRVVHSLTHYSLGVIVSALLVSPITGCKGNASSTPGPVAPPVTADVTRVVPEASSSSTPTPTAPIWTNAFLWEIEGDRPSTLFGSIHLPDPSLTTWPEVLEQCFQRAHAVYTEIPLDNATQLGVATKLVLPNGKTLETELPEPLLRRFKALTASKGIDFQLLAHLKVWAAAVNAANLDRLSMMAYLKPLDGVVFERARVDGKRQGALETVEQQLAIFESLSHQEQLRLLEQTIQQVEEHEKKGERLTDLFMSTYIIGDSDKMLRLVTESFDPTDPLDAKLMKKVFTDRNFTMAKAIQKELKGHRAESLFITVGVGHLPGDGGIVDQLTRSGFKIRRLSGVTAPK